MLEYNCFQVNWLTLSLIEMILKQSLWDIIIILEQVIESWLEPVSIIVTNVHYGSEPFHELLIKCNELNSSLCK